VTTGELPPVTMGDMALKTLIVEDDDRIRAALRLALGEEGYEVVEASDVAEGVAVYEREQPDVLLVDVMLGGSDGRDLIREVRTRSQVPIIITSARGDTTDVVAGLEAGADDYVVKPIVVKELAARMRAVRRRDVVSGAGSSAVPTAADGSAQVLALSPGPDGLTFSAGGGWLKRGDTEVPLTAMEFRLLATLAHNLGQMLSRPQLLERVWGYQSSGDDRLVDVTVRRLRVKLERDPSNPELLVTVRGLGYRLQATR
jgi:DNA-binding response OmpR family regulator